MMPRIWSKLSQAQSLGIAGRCLAGHLDDRNVRAGVFVVEAGGLGLIAGRHGDRQIAGVLVPLGLDRGLERKLKNAATPLYSSSVWPCMTHSDAPPMMVFCGASFNLAQ
jgi:hypothetical protein